MSGALGFLSRANEAVNTLNAFAFGATGGVVLGEFSFEGFEVPDHVTFGGTQQIQIHKLLGGERVFDLTGPDERSIEWSGVFLDGNPYARATELDQMRAAGDVVILSWGPYIYSVVIASFEADTRYSQVPYRISCAVLRNEANSPQASDPSLTDSVLGDVQNAINTVSTAVAPVLQTAQAGLKALQILVPGVPAIGSALAYVGVAQAGLSQTASVANSAIATIGNLPSAVAAVGSQITNAGTALVNAGNTVGSALGVTAAGGLFPNVATLPLAIPSAQIAAQAQVALGFMNRVAANLTP